MEIFLNRHCPEIHIIIDFTLKILYNNTDILFSKTLLEMNANCKSVHLFLCLFLEARSSGMLFPNCILKTGLSKAKVDKLKETVSKLQVMINRYFMNYNIILYSVIYSKNASLLTSLLLL